MCCSPVRLALVDSYSRSGIALTRGGLASAGLL